MAMLFEKVYVIPTIASMRTTYKGDQQQSLTHFWIHLGGENA